MPASFISRLKGRSAATPEVAGSAPDLSTMVGSVSLENMVMTASGTAGHGAELGRYMDLSGLGAVVVKSLSAEPWAGNPAPRVHETPAGMINSVGLQGPGINEWAQHELPELLDTGASVVVSIWGRSLAQYEAAANMCADLPDQVVAVEVNVSCPNVEDRNSMFAHAPASTTEVMSVTAGCNRPRWAKLSPNVTDLAPIVEAAVAGGAEAVTLVNTLMGLVIDTERRRPVLGAGGGGLSGPAIHPVAVRAVYEMHKAFPEVPIVGVGGIASAQQALEFIMAGAKAVQIGTATFANPRAPIELVAQLSRWCTDHNVSRLSDVIGTAH